jgi:hypothetical protein
MPQGIGYAHVSKTEQHLALQVDALKKRTHHTLINPKRAPLLPVIQDPSASCQPDLVPEEAESVQPVIGRFPAWLGQPDWQTSRFFPAEGRAKRQSQTPEFLIPCSEQLVWELPDTQSQTPHTPRRSKAFLPTGTG